MFLFGNVTKEKARKTLRKCATTGDFSKAIKQYSRLLEEFPNDPEILNDLGFALITMQQPDKAIPMQKRNDEALEQLKKAIEAASDYIPAGINLVRLLAGVGSSAHQEMAEQINRLQLLGAPISYVTVGDRPAVFFDGGILCEISTSEVEE